MNPVPVILRAKIARVALAVYPRGLSRSQVMNNVGQCANWRAAELGELLDAMVRDGILAHRLLPRPFPHAPIPEYVASPALRGEGRRRA